MLNQGNMYVENSTNVIINVSGFLIKEKSWKARNSLTIINHVSHNRSSKQTTQQGLFNIYFLTNNLNKSVSKVS